jgi:anthranilate synthase component 2
MGSQNIVQPIECFALAHPNFGRVTLIDAADSFTHNLVHQFLALGAEVIVLRSHEITLNDVETNLGNYLVFSPGPGTPETAGCYKAVIEHYRGKLPILGVCLGMQAINEVFGGRTIPAPVPVHGKISVIEHTGTGIFRGIPSPTPVARYHSLMCDRINPLFTVQSVFHTVPMAMHIPGQIAAVQFHPESFLTIDGLQMLRNFLEESF